MITKIFKTSSFFRYLTLLFLSFFLLNFLNLIVIKFSIIILGTKGFYFPNLFFSFMISAFMGAYLFLFPKELEIIIKIKKETQYFTLKESIHKIRELKLSMQILLLSIMVILFIVMLIFTLGLSLYVYTIFQSKIIVFMFILILLVGITLYMLAIIKSQNFLRINDWEIIWKK